MNLKEHQAKHFLRELGFQTPAGVHCDSAETAEALADSLNTERWVVKAQILSGGRARGFFAGEKNDNAEPHGGVRFANSPQQILDICRHMLGNTLKTAHTGSLGEEVQSIYLEARCDVADELYLALTIDSEQGQLAFIVSSNGGSDIETVAAQDPLSVHQIPVPLSSEFSATAQVCTLLGLAPEQHAEMSNCLKNMIDQFIEKDLRLIEINPLAKLESGELVALDAVVVFDDNALFRQGHPEQMEAYSHLPLQEYLAFSQGMNFVKLDGNIATLSSGAGLAMATIDAICENGGLPANFLDVPPSTAVAKLRDALDLTLQDSDVACLLVNVFGGGIMRCDVVADALLLQHRDKPITTPLVVRFAGTNADLAKQRLRASMPEAQLVGDLAEAAQLCCAIANADDALVDGSNTALWQRFKRLVPDNVS